MDTQKFIENFKDAVEIDDREIALTDKFREYPEWSSLAFLSVIAMIDDEYDVIIEGKDFKILETLQDIVDVIKRQQA
ncbi:MAG: acyl carrier protein [Opitutales bacterium]|nr:acyl carrier protein [Opitutales bacterium]